MNLFSALYQKGFKVAYKDTVIWLKNGGEKKQEQDRQMGESVQFHG